MGYQEEFVSGEANAGAYVCHLTIVTEQLTLRPGGPGTYVPPAPGSHGQPGQVALLGQPPVGPEVLTPFIAPAMDALVTTAGELLAPVIGAVALGVASVLGLILLTTTPAHAPGRPQPVVSPDELRLRELVAKHAAGTLTPDEEAELIALLAKVKGIHVQKLEDLVVNGPLRGNQQPLPGFYYIDLAYTKRSPADVAKLRNQFAAVRKQFVKDLVADPTKIAHLKKVGMSNADIQLMAKGGIPKLYRVHHKLPLDDGGDNSMTNLMLIEDDPWHLAITNFQNVNTVGLQPGQTVDMKWPMYKGYIYP